MSDSAQAHHDDALYAPVSPDGGDGPPDALQILFAHLTGLCSGVLIVLGTTAVVCATVRLL
jgi:hypothetical protein